LIGLFRQLEKQDPAALSADSIEEEEMA